MSRLFFLILAFVVLFFQECGHSEQSGKSAKVAVPEESKNTKNSKELILKKINRLDSLAQLNGVTTSDRNLSQQLISGYSEYVSSYPSDTLSPKYAFLAASVAVNTYSDRQALILIDNCLKNFPSHPRKIELLIMKALVFDDRFGDKTSAKLVYEQIIREFPNTPAAEQAKDAIKLTGKSDLELIREMEKKNGIRK